MAGTLYAALGLHSYILSLVCCAAQVNRTSLAIVSVTHLPPCMDHPVAVQ